MEQSSGLAAGAVQMLAFALDKGTKEMIRSVWFCNGPTTLLSSMTQLARLDD